MNETFGIDGSLCYVSNGMCLGDPRSLFGWGITFVMAILDFEKKNGGRPYSVPAALLPYLEMDEAEIRANTAKLQEVY